MRILGIDIETYSDTDLTKAGVYKYTDSPAFEILLFAYAFDDEDVKCVDLTKDSLPNEILYALTDVRIIKTTFNASFEIQCIQRYFGVQLDVSQWRCTMVQCAQLGLPMNLGGVANALNLDVGKDIKGKALINYFAKPCKPSKLNGGRLRNLPEHDTDKWELFINYCITDVAVERSIRNKLLKFPICDSEQAFWELDQKINDYGVLVDKFFVENATNLNQSDMIKNIERAKELTFLENPKSVTQLKPWIEARIGRSLQDLTKDTIQDLLETVKDPFVKEVLQLKSELAKTSNAKYQAVQNCICSDDRVRGLLQFYGANRTGRWAGRLIQVQNLPQNHVKDLDTARSCVNMGDHLLVKALYDNVPNLLSQLIRTLFIPKFGHRFIVADFSAIEARVIAWLSGEQWRLDVFRSHGRIYEASASQMFKIPIDAVDKSLRQKGKIAELALGYGGGVGALTSMGALNMGLSEDDLQPLVNTWRITNPKIIKFWKDVENACYSALEGYPTNLNHGLHFSVSNGILFITLPCGRKLAYVKPCVGENRFGGKSLKYMGVNQTTRKWEYIDTFGGKLVENITQAVARDCLAYALQTIDSAGYNINFHVHDEIIVEVPKGQSSVEELCGLMGQVPPWAKGLPLRADGYACEYYKKE